MKALKDIFLTSSFLETSLSDEELSVQAQNLTEAIDSDDVKKVCDVLTDILDSDAYKAVTKLDENGQLPLKRAINFLVQKDADSLIEPVSTVLFFADASAKDANGDTVLHALIKEGNFVGAALSVVMNPAFKERDANGKTPIECVQDLIDTHFVEKHGSEGGTFVYDKHADQDTLHNLLLMFKLLARVETAESKQTEQDKLNPFYFMTACRQYLNELGSRYNAMPEQGKQMEPSLVCHGRKGKPFACSNERTGRE